MEEGACKASIQSSLPCAHLIKANVARVVDVEIPENLIEHLRRTAIAKLVAHCLGELHVVDADVVVRILGGRETSAQPRREAKQRRSERWGQPKER